MQMNFNKKPANIFILLLLVIILLGSTHPVHAGSKQLEDPLFWINKIKKPEHLLLTPSEIEKMNEESLKRQEILLCRIKDIKE